MLFLMLFVVLAIGFYASTAMSAQLAANERLISTSQVAAESGMEYMQYHLACLDIPVDKPADKVFEEVYLQLRQRLLGTGNLGTRDIGYDGCTISIPADPSGYIKLAQSGSGFRASITDGGSGVIVVKVTGTPDGVPSSLGRAIEMEYFSVNYPSAVFDYGVASRGKVQLKNSANTKLIGTPDAAASVLATFAGAPSIVTGSGVIEGDLAVVVNKSQVSLGSGSVGGGTTAADILANHVHLVPAPVFPTVDTSVFKPFATNVYSGAAYQKNIRVPPNTNPKFNGGDVIEGILYIESPNNVTFRGHATINGLIVFENKNGVAQNTLDFRGNVSPAKIPNTPEFAALRAKAKGLALAAPAAAVTMSGSVDGDITGSIIADKLTLGGSADLILRQGSLITLGTDATLIEGKTVHFVGNAKENPPYQSVRLNVYFKPDLTTYREVRQ